MIEQKSKLTYNQKKKVTINEVIYEGQKVDLIITLRYDDECRNGYNTFSITANMYQSGKRSERALISCGCLHEAIAKLAPEYAHLIKWHLMSSDEPLHYVANTIYHASKIEKFNYYVYFFDEKLNIKPELLGIYTEEEADNIKRKYGDSIKIEKKADGLNKDIDLEAARSSALAPNATLEQLQSKEWLMARLPQLQNDFKATMESLGFEW